MADQDIIFERRGALMHVTLNRPKALNALTREMCQALAAGLADWAAMPEIGAVAIRGTGGRAFCAGGDIRKLYEEGRKGGRYPFDFYWDEYRCNARVKHFPKPYVALLDGIVMGGGVGVSAHGSHRVVTANTVFAMPETGIGLFPDVGCSYFLPRCPGQLGMYLGLTGARLKAADAVYAHVGDRHVPAERLDALEAALAEAAGRQPAGPVIDAALAEFASAPGVPQIARHREAIDRIFALPSVEDIVAALQAEPGDFAAATLQALQAKSPTSLKITFREIREGARLDFDDCMRMEWRMVNRVIRGHDFYEGTRAVVIDKDQRPAWKPDRLEAVTERAVDAYFAPLPERELSFD